jgi:putative ABC transport system substrate-binding protein
MLEIVPGLLRIGLLRLKEGVRSIADSRRYEEAARSFKIELRGIEIRAQNPDLPTAFATAINARVNALIPMRNGTINRLTPRIAELAIKNRLPTMFERTGAVENGGLVSYTADELEGYRRTATYVDKILKGAKPANLPVEQPTKFEFVINLNTAKQLGLTVPERVLARADRVIK